MNASPNPTERCANCQRELAADRAAGLTYCAACGTTLPALAPDSGSEAAPAPSPDGRHGTPLSDNARRHLRICFWILFLVTPIAGILVGSAGRWMEGFLPAFIIHLVPQPLKVLGTFACGVVGSSYCLVRLRGTDRSTAQLITGTILIAFGLCLAYLGIAFFGCALLAGLLRAGQP